MSSGHDSTGDLIPPDMLEVFAQDRQGKRSKRTRKRGSFSRAFTWFKSRRRKTLRANKDANIDLLTPGSSLPIPLLPPSTGHKEVSGTPLPVHIHENVFNEGNQPKFAQYLRSEAQEGLQLLQQDENRNGDDFQDDQSVISTVTARTDDDVSFSELAMSECDSTADTISTRSTISYQSSRSGLTRQGSTFRPLSEGRKHGKRKTKSRNASIVPGIPRHIQKELGLDRAAWTASQFTQAQLSNGGLSISTVVPTLDSISIASDPDGALMLMHSINSVQDFKENKKHIPSAEGHRDDLHILQHFLPQSSDPERPGSLAAPWITTSGHCPPSPVMYVSPEATYKSKIIPNAILVPSVDVVELKRNRTRSSVRMVTQSSLASASPAPSRSSSRASSRISSRASSRFSSRVPSRASSCRTYPHSEYSGMSNSDSSETLVSDASTISNSSTPRVTSRASQQENTDGPVKGNVKDQHVQLNGDNIQTWTKPGTAGPFNRSLSVTKKSKKPPPPPHRSYSLHAQQSKLNAKLKTMKDKSDTPDNGSWKLVSPYSQNDSVQYKMNIENSQYNERQNWIKLKESLPYFKNLSANGVTPSPTVMAFMTLLDVPDPPHVLAPPPPPPETWAHNQHTFELLCGPGPVNLECWAFKRGLKLDCVPQSIKTQSTKTNGDVVPLVSEASKSKFQGNLTVNGMNHNIVASNKKLITLPRMDTDVQLTNGNNLSLPDSGSCRLPHIPSPPCEPLPSLLPLNQTKVMNEDVSTQKAHSRLPIADILFPPPHPHFPPPPPPQKVPCSSTGQDQTDICSSENTIPPPPQIIPPPPPIVPTPTVIPPPPQIIPPPPPIVPPPPQVNLPLPQISQIPQKTKANTPHAIPPPSWTVPLTQIPPPPPQLNPAHQYEIPPPPHLIPPPPQFISSAPEVIPAPPEMIPPPPQIIPPPSHIIPSLQKEMTPSKESLSHPVEKSTPPKTALTTADEIPPRSREESSVQASVPLTANVPPPPPPPPPLPTDIKKEVKSFLPEKQDKQSAESPPSATTKEESPTPMVTQSLLQTVRLRSVRSNVNRVEASPAGPPKPKQQSNQNPPQKPVRRSLILTAPDLISQSGSDVDNDQLPTNKDYTSTSDLKKESPSTLQDATNLQVDPVIVLDTTAEPKTSLNHENEPTPTVTVPESQSVAVSASQTSAEQNSQPGPSETQTGHHEIQTGSSKKETPNMVSVSGPQTVAHKPSPTQKGSPLSAPTSSMRLQEAIRLKTAAMSSKDNQTNRLSLHSPPPSAGGISPTSTANFIFSKSTKKVVIETSSSPETQANLQKNLMSELTALPQASKARNLQSKSLKFPPPVAKKPSTKSENAAHNSSETENNADTEHVHTAGQ